MKDGATDLKERNLNGLVFSILHVYSAVVHGSRILHVTNIVAS